MGIPDDSKLRGAIPAAYFGNLRGGTAAQGASKIAMRLRALATDYDGTLAMDGRVESSTIAALEALRASGRFIVLVTGRELADLMGVFPRLDLADRVVAENGALLYSPSTAEEKLLCAPVAPEFVSRLSQMHIPAAVGRAIVATSNLHEKVVRSVIREMGLNLRVILNKGSAMVLPFGVDKQSGLRHALAELSVKLEEVAAIGDAENDHALLDACGYAVAVANALPELKSRADLVTVGAHGAGVVELINRWLADDLGEVRGSHIRGR